MVYDDGDESDCTWREIQLGLIWGQTGGFVAGEHDDPLPTGPIGSAGSTEWSLEEEEELRPQFPELEDHYESTDGAGGQFQGETNYGQIGRGASGSPSNRPFTEFCLKPFRLESFKRESVPFRLT